MDNLYRFGNIEVLCEGYDYPDDSYILKGSCGLEYTLDYTKEGMYVCIEVALRGDAHGIGRSNWAKGRDPSGSWVQYPNPAVPTAPRHSRWIILTH